MDKLFAGVAGTTDPHSMWLAPFTPGERHEVAIAMPAGRGLSRLRLWNYNASRTHCSRGARHAELHLDGTLLWGGELQQAPGYDTGDARHATDIVLSDEPATLHKLRALDEQTGASVKAKSRTPPHAEAAAMRISLGIATQRPGTASDLTPSPEGPLGLRGFGGDLSPVRPAAAHAPPSKAERLSWEPSPGSATTGAQLVCTILSTWGDANYYGLAGLELLGEKGERVPVTVPMLAASPRDLNELQPGSHDPRTVDKLVDGINATTDSNHMWLAPWQPETGRAHTLRIDLPRGVPVGALRVWNYNKSEEDAARGIQRLLVHLDGVLVSAPGGVVLRKGPGHDRFDHAQLVPLLLKDTPKEGAAADDAADDTRGAYRGAVAARDHGYVPFAPLPQDYYVPALPSAFSWTVRAAPLLIHTSHTLAPLLIHTSHTMALFSFTPRPSSHSQVRLLSSWGDVHYLGLDALQLFGVDGAELLIDDGAGLVSCRARSPALLMTPDACPPALPIPSPALPRPHR